MRQPVGFTDGTDRVVRLLRSLYRLKQAARLWNRHMTAQLKSVGFRQLFTDNAVYIRDTELGTTITGIHVDNALTFSSSRKELAAARHDLHSLFEMKEEDPNWIMGFELFDDRKQGTISISHEKYIISILRRFKMEDCTPEVIPMRPSYVLTKDDGPKNAQEADDMKRRPYRELLGALTWISVISRPDISFAVNNLAQFNADPGPKHWRAAKRILQYLTGTRDYRLVLGGDDADTHTFDTLAGYSDSDWARNIDDRRSVSGYVFKIGKATVAWSSKKQTTVAASSTEGGYMALSFAAKQGLWMRRLLTEMGCPHERAPTTIRGDNQGSIDLTKDARHHARTKHIDVHHHFVRERVSDGTFVVEHQPSRQLVADILTKPLEREDFERLRDSLGLVPA
ncbi:hypothetical protein CERSUDRAFT_124463 [Gelatoporia subvermispora B]|uniref:Reverse transcriptase Ty1/copia-type domain-containing protein n=1 Tax=Ceriporiopsis subvermispora (strain B) TaxID=914234 RepID=M2QFN1_CERS8|nr:hypothetical protein CERSUDRAFT_124463 [Gelatoporia subvermispora B]